MQIFFDTATFDEIERDEKIKFEAQLSLIGGTMGLLTGFSIISGIEIIFLLFRFIPIIKNAFGPGSKTEGLSCSYFPGWSALSGSPGIKFSEAKETSDKIFEINLFYRCITIIILK